MAPDPSLWVGEQIRRGDGPDCYIHLMGLAILS
jgi:hypothetical protein